MPELTDLPPAPDELLKMIRCYSNCHTDCSSVTCLLLVATAQDQGTLTATIPYNYEDEDDRDNDTE